MKAKIKFIIPIIIAVIAIIIAALYIDFKPAERTDVTSLVSTAQKYLLENNYEQAIAEFEKVIELDPMNADAYIGIAKAYVKIGDAEKAVKWLEKGYELTRDERLRDMIDKLNSRESSEETPAPETTPASAPENEIINNDDGSYYEMAFNTDGKIVHEDFYDKNGKRFGYADIEYYPNGNKKIEKYYREDGSYYVSEYDTDEKLTKKTSYNSDGSIFYYEIYEYDPNGNMILKTSYYGDDDSIRKYDKHEYDSNNYEIYYEFYESVRYRKEVYTDENLWEESTESWNVKYNDDYTIVYEYANDNGLLLLGGDNGIKECFMYDNTGKKVSHLIYSFDENNRKNSCKEYNYNSDNSEDYYGYIEYSYDNNDNLKSSKSYYKNYENGSFELASHSVYTYDGLGNFVTITSYNSDGSITWQQNY